MDHNTFFPEIEIPDIEYGFQNTLPETTDKVSSIADALIASKNECGDVNVEYMKTVFPALTAESLFELRDSGAIFQDPKFFSEGEEYSVWDGWVLRENYLSGFISDKLKDAKAANEFHPGCFDKNICALTKLLPAALSHDDIHVSLGASWISHEIYEEFISDLLQIKARISISYSKENGQWYFDPSDLAKMRLNLSVLNKYTYGSMARDNRRTYLYEIGMTAFDIIRHTMNAQPVKVYDSEYTFNSMNGFDCEKTLNRNATLAAQDKQRLIISKFEEWTKENELIREKLRECYNDTFVGYAYSPYDGSFLKFSDMNPEVTLFPHQKDAIARLLLSKSNTLLAHDVGTGKTYEMIAGVHELHRTGLSEKNLVVVPNNVLKATVDAHRYLYPNDRILTVFPTDFIPAHRKKVLEDIKTESYVAIYMAYSSFDMITMSVDYWINKTKKEIDELSVAVAEAKTKAEKNALKASIRSLQRKKEKIMTEAIPSPWENFDNLGINTLVVDEAHNYKNIPLATKTDNIIGMHPKGSKKCSEMFEKAHFCDRLIFATGTPLTNSIADLFVLQSYLQPEALRFRGIDRFDMWINCFGERETNYEIDVDSTSLRPVTRFSTFHNLTELMCLFSEVCDFHHSDEDDSELPTFNGYIDIRVKKSEKQAEYIRNLAKRAELVRQHISSRCDDNLLKIAGDGRKCALSPGLVGITDDNDGESKTDECALEAARLYFKYPGTCQAVFCDIGTPKSSYNVYDVLRDRLVFLGIPKAQIAYVHDATSEAKRAALFRAVNEGTIRIVIGSTAKLGIGVNVQEKLIAVHHLSVPWRPADMVQREGRIIRRGNTCREVFIYRYVTEGSFDSYSWQLLESKQRFISSFLTGCCTDRKVNDISDTVLSYAEIKALAIGNPLIKLRVETSNRLERVKASSRQRQKQLIELRSVVDSTPEKLNEISRNISIIEKDLAQYQRSRTSIPMSERISFGEELLLSLGGNILQNGDRLFDTYQGFSIILPANMTEERPHVFLKSENGGKYYVDMKCDSPLGCSKRIDYILDHLDGRIESLKAEAAETQKRRLDALSDMESGNPYLKKIDRLTSELEQIDKKLSESEDKAS